MHWLFPAYQMLAFFIREGWVWPNGPNFLLIDFFSYKSRGYVAVSDVLKSCTLSDGIMGWSMSHIGQFEILFHSHATVVHKKNCTKLL